MLLIQVKKSKKSGIHFDLPQLKNDIHMLETTMNQEGFWDDASKAQQLLKQLKGLKGKTDQYEKLAAAYEDIVIMMEMLAEDYGEEDAQSTEEDLKALTKDVEKYKLSILLNGEYDSNNAILSIHPGAGGTESQDWADMLLRMYLRYGEKNGYKVTTLDYLPGDVAGIKSVTLLFEGFNAYGYLKAEKGVHRLVRISPFDSASRRHTSFTSVDIIPEIDDDIQLEIDPGDLRIDTYRSGGAGGQHVNKTDSAVRITHLPTGIVVACQNERSQRQNKETAMRILKGKLIEILEQEKKDKIADIQGNYGQIAWGNQIRSYVLHPYNMVKDHRTSIETSNAVAVLDGDINDFIDGYLKNALSE